MADAARPLGRKAGDRRSILALLNPRLFAPGGIQLDLDYYRECLTKHPRLIVVVAHGGMISWVPISLVLWDATATIDPERRVVGTVHPILWKLPMVRPITRLFSASEEHCSFGSLLRAYLDGERFDYYAFPESESCLYGDLGEIKPFRFHGFLELALRTGVPLLLVVHRGSERWYQSIPIPEERLPLVERVPDRAFHALELNKRVFVEELRRHGTLNLPLHASRLRLHVEMEMYTPEPTVLATSYRARMRQLEVAGLRMRERMQALYDRIGVPSASQARSRGRA